jgi:HD-GYP domain-containing protein (c-di-GMP phosphodiesterase class II)/DNA-binding CsgD family transcriptional regulator
VNPETVTLPVPYDHPLPVFDPIKALAFVGDLSMGQPIDHSTRTAWIATQLAAAAGFNAEVQGQVACTALLRWSGCTANAPEFSELFGDDVGGRRIMLANTSTSDAAGLARSLGPAAEIHCEVSGEVARVLGMPAEVERALRCMFESFDGQGKPRGLPAAQIPDAVFIVTIAADLEIFSRTHGLARALASIIERGDARYPASLVDIAARHAAGWIDAVERDAASALTPPPALRDAHAAPELLADVIDLKFPWMTGFSRRVAATAQHCAQRLGLDDEQCERVRRAGLIHGMGRASVPNAVWESTAARSEADRERLRLVSYWTHRAANRIEALRDAAEIASYVDERLDGSGCFRGAKGAAIDTGGRILALAMQWVWLRTARPGVPALSDAQALAALHDEVQLGRFDATVLAALAQEGDAPRLPAKTAANSDILSVREVEVLGRISLGDSNKEAARILGISPSTVRAHLENIFRKLECNTRAAATLKASSLGLF